MTFKLLTFFGYFMATYIMSQGISLIVRQRDFDLIAYLFYDEKYLDLRTWDLSPAPYWVSLTLGLFLIIFSIWLTIKNLTKR